MTKLDERLARIERERLNLTGPQLSTITTPDFDWLVATVRALRDGLESAKDELRFGLLHSKLKRVLADVEKGCDP